jgi:two-component system chemotaxis sensor kinase CheA
MNELLEGFFVECEELLEVLADGLDALAGDTSDSETINSVFRSVHSIKGGAGAFGMDVLVEFSHAFENVLDALRSDKIQLSASLMPILYQASDHLNTLVEMRASTAEDPPKVHQSLIADLQLACQDCDPSEPSEAECAEVEFDVIGFEPLGLVTDPAADAGQDNPISQTPAYEIRFAPFLSLFEHGLEPLLMFRALAELGDLTVKVDHQNFPCLKDWNDGSSCVVWTITLLTDALRSEVEHVFEFTRDLCDLDIIEVSIPLENGLDNIDAFELPDLTDDASQSGGPDTSDPPIDVPIHDLQNDNPIVAANFDAAEAGGDDEVDHQTPTQSSVGVLERLAPATKPPAAKRTNRETLRVELDRVDRLVNIVGELVISEAMLRQSMSDSELSSNSSAANAMVQLKQLSGELQESVMAIRAQPVRGLFQRMSRIVRETARETGKEACLITEGDATEVDKTVTERLIDPLTHMIRNAVDHGLEDPEVREKNGKTRVGTVSLSAAHRSGRISIQLRDDGGGINRERVRETAIKKGLVSTTDELSDADTDNLLFAPGFSTNEVVSNLSGRGVGMDVVRSEIQSLGGRVTISSRAGEGTIFSISLPLTLAVLEGMIVSVAGERLVVPTTCLRETVRVSEASVHIIGRSERVLAMPDGLIPVIDLGDSLGFRSSAADEASQSLLLIEADSGRRVALAVDEVFDQREVVIKGLEQNYQRVHGIAAATILGDGRIALIVDTDQLIPQGPSVSDQMATDLMSGASRHV